MEHLHRGTRSPPDGLGSTLRVCLAKVQPQFASVFSSMAIRIIFAAAPVRISKSLALPAKSTEPSETALDHPRFRKDSPSVFDLSGNVQDQSACLVDEFHGCPALTCIAGKRLDDPFAWMQAGTAPSITRLKMLFDQCPFGVRQVTRVSHGLSSKKKYLTLIDIFLADRL